MALSAHIGPYRVLRLIGQGGQGNVYLGYDTRLHRPVAIKIHRLPRDRAGRKHLLREAQLIASVQGSKVVQVYDLVVGRGNVALIMEYVPGCDLEEFLCATSPSVASVLTIATDLAGALAAARQRRVVHGDLKARNVLITDSGRVKLTDFGIARRDSDSTPGTTGGASPSCVSPEQYLGKSIDLRSDLFALGCLLYRMLSGCHPFVREGQLDPRALLEEVPPAVDELVADLPVGLAGLVAALMQKAPEDRPQSTQEVTHALRNIARGMPLAASSRLLEESRAYFREESPGDIPPAVPSDLRRGGRSRLQPFQFDKLSSWRSALPRLTPLRIAGVLIILLFIAALMPQVLRSGETLIHVPEPVFQVNAATSLPSEVTLPWLVEQLKQAASTELGPIVVSGPIGATATPTFYSSARAPKIDEQLSVSLRCRDSICLLTLARQRGASRRSVQTMIFPDSSLAEWAGTVRSTATRLYD